MRRTGTGPVLKVRAVAGLHVVMLAWDFKKKLTVTKGTALPDPLKDLMGFAISRDELDKNGNVVESYVMRGIKRFKDKDQGLPPGTLVPFDEHPIQSFLWGDYTAKPRTTYEYTVTPVYGKPKKLDVRTDRATSVTVTTEAEKAPAGASGIRHDVWFNRGVIGSQAYARRFSNQKPDPDKPDSAPMKWLSRGLFEALLEFIADAEDERYALRAAFYEFHYQPVANALRKAVDAGVDVKIVYDAESSYKHENMQTLTNAGLLHNDIQIPRTVTEGIRHNKFIVLLKNDKPVAVWTGSTNISAGGIFGHSNVGHVVRDPGVAKAFLDYWKRLAANLTPGKLREPNRTATPTPAKKPPKDSVLPLFSPRDPKDSVETLQWYADRMAEAKRLVCITLAFNLDPVLSDALTPDSNVLRYIVKDDDLSATETIGSDRDLVFAVGGRFDEGALENFVAERDNPLNSNDYIHNKFLLVDPLGDDPLVVCGSANFSRPSQTKNDENMLVIRGDTRVADIYFGEYMRVFDHHYARYVVRTLREQGDGDPNVGYLKDTADKWVRSYWNTNSYKEKRRRYFVEG
jgi:phosphatidylserine/phosphatidylglycerophosphate/cardiolipin synthase-like enzyme